MPDGYKCDSPPWYSGSRKPVLPSVVQEPDIVVVSLVESVTLPSHKGCVVKGVVLSPDHVRTDLLFEPNHDVMDSLGLCAEESVVTPSGEGEVSVVACSQLSGCHSSFGSWCSTGHGEAY
jgi:hypothetical protein